MEEIIIAFCNLVLNGVKALAEMKEKTKERLVKVYLEVRRNKTILLKSGLLQTSVITRDDDTFIDTAFACR